MADLCADQHGFGFCLLVFCELRHERRISEFDPGELLAYTIMQILSDALLLATTDRQKLLFQLPAVDYRREDVRDRLEEVGVVLGEFSPVDLVGPKPPSGARTAMA